MLLQPNTTFDNHYTLIRQLGRGGFSEVWLAHDSYMDIDVAIKIYAPGQGMDPNSINEFRREITGVFQLNHPNLLCPKHLGIWENMPYLIMAYCPAGSCLKFVGNISESEIWHLIHDVAAGLAYLHEKDIVHQDIKPDNILIDTEGNYLITDFGISTRARSTLRKSVMSTTNSAGTLAYMGPERFSTQPAPTKASDIWSLGAMLYELLEGVTPFPPDFGGSMLNAGAAIPTINAPVSENLKQTIYKMLSKETWDRPTADTLVEWTNNQNKQCIVVDAEIQGYVDLGLPSGTLWKKTNEGGDNAHYTNSEAVSQFGNRLPTKQQLAELYDECEWIWDVNGCKVIGPSGKFIWLPAAGSNGCEEKMRLQGVGKSGYYWSAPYDSDTSCPWCISFDSRKRKVSLHDIYKSFYLSVRLVDCAKNLPSIENSTLPTSKGLWEEVQQSQHSKQPTPKRWIWIIVTLLLIAGLGMIGIRKYQDHQLEIAIKEQIRQDSIRQIQIQDSIREVRRQDSIAAAQAEQERQLRLQKEKEERQRKENERKRREQICIDSIAKEAERKRIAEEKRIQSLRGFHNGHEYVDLGLSVKWAICNVGADYPEDYGNYFAWGEVTTKHNYDWSTYKYCYKNHQHLTKYNFLSEFGSVDNKRILESSDDAATINWGGNWRMPTKKEFDELRKFCSWKWTKINGINGYLITSNKENYEGVSIFLPAAGCRREYSHYYENNAGCYNSSTLGDGDTRHVYELYFYSSSISCKSGYVRYCGQTVRAVCK